MARYLLALLFAVPVAGPVAAQPAADPFAGDWLTHLEAGGGSFLLRLHVTADAPPVVTLDVMDQDAFGLPMDSVHVDGDSLRFRMPQTGVQPWLHLAPAGPDRLGGRFVQRGHALPIAFAREGTPGAAEVAALVAEATRPPKPLGWIAREAAPQPARLRDLGLDYGRVEPLIGAAMHAHSDAVVLLKAGALVGEWYAGPPRPIYAGSVTASVVGLLVGRLVTQGRLDLDAPVAAFYPEWKGTPYEAITVRHLLAQTSGLEPEGEGGAAEDALGAPLTHVPGTHFAYDDAATSLLGGVIAQTAGMPLDGFAAEALFAPLGVTTATWEHDAAGQPRVTAGLTIAPRDLARLGQLVADDGRHGDVQLLAPSFLLAMTSASDAAPDYGLLWGLIRDVDAFIVDDGQLDALRAAGVDAAFLARAEAARGRYEIEEAYLSALEAAFGATWPQALTDALAPHGATLSRKSYGPLRGVVAGDESGQHLVVLPDDGLVGVRMVETAEGYTPGADAFEDFPAYVEGLVGD